MHGAHVRGGHRHELHAAARAAARLLRDDLGVHGAGVGRGAAGGLVEVHLGDERQRLVRLGRQVAIEALALGAELRVAAQLLERLGQRGLGRLVAHRDRREPVDLLGRVVLERELAGALEEHVEDHALRRRQDRLLDDLLALAAAAVAADELHARPGQLDLEDARVGGVGQIQAHHLALPRLERELGLSGDEQHVAEAAHRGVRGLRTAERRDPAVLDEHVVEREHPLAVHGRPVVRVRGLDDDVAVEAHLLPVVLADMRVVPVQARIRERDGARVAPADGDRRLRLVRAVGAVVEAQAVPVHRRLEIALVDDVDLDLRALRHAQGRSWHRAVVGEHAHLGVADALPDAAMPSSNDPPGATSTISVARLSGRPVVSWEKWSVALMASVARGWRGRMKSNPRRSMTAGVALSRQPRAAHPQGCCHPERSAGVVNRGRVRTGCSSRSGRTGAGTTRDHEELASPRLGRARRTPA